MFITVRVFFCNIDVNCRQFTGKLTSIDDNVTTKILFFFNYFIKKINFSVSWFDYLFICESLKKNVSDIVFIK
jgi:hypothetical protein